VCVWGGEGGSVVVTHTVNEGARDGLCFVLHWGLEWICVGCPSTAPAGCLRCHLTPA
jgi:hypothetical protein